MSLQNVALRDLLGVITEVAQNLGLLHQIAALHEQQIEAVGSRAGAEIDDLAMGFDPTKSSNEITWNYWQVGTNSRLGRGPCRSMKHKAAGCQRSQCCSHG